MKPLPRVIPAGDRVIQPGLQTPGITREEAFAADDRWVGFVRTEPGDWSGWHHHGDHDSYFFILQGGLEFEYLAGAERETISIGPGDFAQMPSRIVHRERTVPNEPGQVVLVRIGRGPTVFNVEDPESQQQ